MKLWGITRLERTDYDHVLALVYLSVPVQKQLILTVDL
jgi:hypothetical protein